MQIDNTFTSAKPIPRPPSARSDRYRLAKNPKIPLSDSRVSDAIVLHRQA